MKLGKKNHMLNIIITFFFMTFVCFLTIGYLYSNNNITKDEYMKLLLSDAYGNDFYTNLVEIINKNFNPLNIIEMKEVNSNSFDLHNRINISNPLVYIYNDSSSDEYRKEYNVRPNVILASYLLSEKLNDNGIETIFEDNNIEEFSKNNNLSINKSIDLFLSDKKNNYPSIKYILNIGRVDSNNKSVVTINNKKYALISLYASKENISLITKLNRKLNEKYNGISKIYFDESYNSSINIDFGNKGNTMKEVLNSIEAFSNVFIEVI